MDRKFTRESAGSRIDQFLGSVFRQAHLDIEYTLRDDEKLHEDFENPDLIIRFTGQDVDLLLENKAELLLALEQLTAEMLGMSSDEHSRLFFDAHDYRVLRIEELRMSAVTAAERVKKTRVPFQFSPMNSRERRIIHLALRNETEVRSESVGMGPFRQVCIVPADMKELPPARPMRPGGPGGPRGRGGPRGDRPDRGPRGPRGDRGDRGGRDRRGPRR